MKCNVDPSPREYLSYVDPLVIKDDTMPIFPTNTTPSFNTLPSRNETLMTSGNPSPNIDPIHDNIFVQEEPINTSFNNIYHTKM